jgi:hypothetical protein
MDLPVSLIAAVGAAAVGAASKRARPILEEVFRHPFRRAAIRNEDGEIKIIPEPEDPGRATPVA